MLTLYDEEQQHSLPNKNPGPPHPPRCDPVGPFFDAPERRPSQGEHRGQSMGAGVSERGGRAPQPIMVAPTRYLSFRFV